MLHMVPHCGWRFDLQFPDANHAGPPGRHFSVKTRQFSTRGRHRDVWRGQNFVELKHVIDENICFCFWKHLCSKVLHCSIVYNILKITVAALHVGCNRNLCIFFTSFHSEIVWRSCNKHLEQVNTLPRMRSKATWMVFFFKNCSNFLGKFPEILGPPLGGSNPWAPTGGVAK